MPKHFCGWIAGLVLAAACTPLKPPLAKSGNPGTDDSGVLAGGNAGPEAGLGQVGSGAGAGAGDAGGALNPGDGSTAEACATPGALRCSGSSGQRERCAGGTWAPTDACQTDEVCSTKPDSTGSCLAVAEFCKGNANQDACDAQGVMFHCNAQGVAESMQACASVRHCQLGLANGVCAGCLPGEYRCTDTSLELCDDDGQSFASVKTCPTAALCNAGAGDCTSSTCSLGQFSCQGDLLRKCNASQDGWDDVQSCNPGLCDAAAGVCDVCVPGTKTCDMHTTVTCNSTGQDYDRSACPSAMPECVGNGQCVQCASDSDCPDPGTCKTRHCDLGSGGCIPDFVKVQTPCSGGFCDGAGNCASCLYDQDCPDPGECKLKYCDATTNVCQPQSAGNTVSCSLGHCDTGVCVQCSNASECADRTCQIKSCSGGQCQYANVTPGQPGNCSSGVCTANQQCRECVSDAQCTRFNGLCTVGHCNTSTNACEQQVKTGSCGTLKMCSGTSCVDSCGNGVTDTQAGEQCDPTAPFLNNWECDQTNCTFTGLSAGSSGTSYRKKCSSDTDCATNEMCAISLQIGAITGQTSPICLPQCSNGMCRTVPGYTLYQNNQSTACTAQASCVVACSQASDCPPGLNCVSNAFCGGPFF